LGLRAGLENIGVYQKQIVDRCVTRGKPVITATQMLLSMTEFREPKRPEVTDVTNAIFDGSDALMLSEETADPESKFPVEAIETMAGIAETAEQEIHRLNRLEYQYQIDHRFDKIKEQLAEQRAEVENQSRAGALSEDEFRAELERLDRREIADNICYNACKLAHELNCRAIVVLTGTGGTARLVSRFKPDRPILAGVYRKEIARLLGLSYGVQPFLIAESDSGYPFGEFERVLARARETKLVAPGDRVVLVSRYPRRETDTITLLNLYRVRQGEG
jgi:pyruvate kinase